PNASAPRRGTGFISPPAVLDALKAFGFNLLGLSNNHSWDMDVAGVENTVREADRAGLVHAGTGKTLHDAASPAILKTSKGTVALVAMASGQIEDGAAATSTRPGPNELHLQLGNVPNEEDARRIHQSIRDATKQADFVMVYQHNHTFDKPFGDLFAEALPD